MHTLSKQGNEFSSTTGSYATSTHCVGGSGNSCEWVAGNQIIVGVYQSNPDIWGGSATWDFDLQGINLDHVNSANVKIEWTYYYGKGLHSPDYNREGILKVNNNEVARLKTNYTTCGSDWFAHGCGTTTLAYSIPLSYLSSITSVNAEAGSRTAWDIGWITLYINETTPECEDDNGCNHLDKDYCSGDTRKHDEGKCISNSCQTLTTTYDCNNDNANYCDGTQIKHKDYTCNSGVCVLGSTTLVQECNDGLYCNGQETCDNAACILETDIDCSANNLAGIATCNNNPDNNPFTWDYFAGFTSTCNEAADQCTTGTIALTHKCNASCGAVCEKDIDCGSGKTCLSNCTCSSSGYCTVPYDGMIITKNTTFCSGTHNLSNGTIINAKNIILDCNGAVLYGSDSYQSVGLKVNGANNKIKNCYITRFYYGIFVNYSRNITLTNNYIYANDGQNGISIYYSNNTSIINNTVTENYDGIYSYESKYLLIKDNGIYLNDGDGIIIYNGIGNLLGNNLIHSNGYRGIYLQSSPNNSITKNNIYSHRLGGIDIEYGMYSNLINNTIYLNNESGINLGTSTYGTLRNNTIFSNEYNIKIEYPYESSIDTSNTVNGKPAYHWINKSNKKIPSDAGYVALVDCRNITVENLNISNEYYGLLLHKTYNSTLKNLRLFNNNHGLRMDFDDGFNQIKDCDISNNNYGLYMSSSNNNIVQQNIISNNQFDGFYMYYSSNNNITRNSIKENGNGIVYSYSSNNNFIHYNNILKNKDYNFQNSDSLNVSAENNWWGLINKDEIEKKIYDYYDNQYVGVVDYEPYLYGPFDGNWFPIIDNLKCQSDSIWKECSEMKYNSTLAKVRVNCTDLDGNIIGAKFELQDIKNHNTLFTGNGIFDSGYWVYDNPDLLLNYDLLKLSASCTDNSSAQSNLSKRLILGESSIFYESFDGIESINKNNGTVLGTIGFTETKCGKAGNLTLNPYISYPLNENFPSESDLTIEFWFRNTHLSSQGFFDIARLYGEHPNSMGIFYSTSYNVNRVITEIRNDYTGMYQAHAPGTLVGDKWNHVAVTFSDYDRENKKFTMTTYFNGNPGQPVTVSNFYPNLSNDFWVGRNSYYGYSSAYMDEFKIFDYALSNERIYNDYLYMKNCTKEYMSKKNCTMGKPEGKGKVKINCNGLSVDNEPFKANGVGYQPIPIGKTANIAGGANVIFNTPVIYNRDFLLLRKMNANTIRTWAAVTNRSFLDSAWNNGTNPIYVVMGFWINCDDNYGDLAIIQKYLDNFSSYVRAYKDHPSVLVWALGNEVNLCGNANYIDEYYSLCNELAKKAYEIEGENYHPVGIVNWDLNHIGLNIYNSKDQQLNYLDYWGVNVYPGDSFSSWLDDYSMMSGKPLLITEYGIDALNNTKREEYEDVQAEWVLNQWREINNSNITIGSTLMEYSDEWWKCGSNWDHDFCGYMTPKHPDGYANEEWWGVMRIAKGDVADIVQPRKVYYALKRAWGNGKEEIELSLKKGWNLISIPLELQNNSFSYLFNKTNFTVLGYKDDLWFTPSSADNKLGYWVKTNKNMTLAFEGNAILDKQINLNQGWNLVGYPYLEEQSTPAIFENADVYAYNGSWISYIPTKPFNSLKTLKPGYGYWVKK